MVLSQVCYINKILVSKILWFFPTQNRIRIALQHQMLLHRRVIAEDEDEKPLSKPKHSNCISNNEHGTKLKRNWNSITYIHIYAFVTTPPPRLALSQSQSAKQQILNKKKSAMQRWFERKDGKKEQISRELLYENACRNK